MGVVVMGWGGGCVGWIPAFAGMTVWCGWELGGWLKVWVGSPSPLGRGEWRAGYLIDLYTGIVYNLYIHIANWRESAEAV